MQEDYPQQVLETVVYSADTYLRNRRYTRAASVVGGLVAGAGFVIEQLNGEQVDPLGAAMLVFGVSSIISANLTSFISRITYEQRVKSI